MAFVPQCMIAACQRLNIPYRIMDDFATVIAIDFETHTHLVSNTTLGLNNEAVAKILRDKFHSYKIFSPHVLMPETIAYIDPDAAGPWKKLTTTASIKQMVVEIRQKFSGSVIVKRNSGTQGHNVFLCETPEQASDALYRIFSKNQVYYDHVALVQPFIKPKQEIRAVLFNHTMPLAYIKDVSRARFKGNLSPLHWENAAAVPVTDPVVLKSLRLSVTRIASVLPVVYAGLDFVLDSHDQLWLIELNGSPGYTEFGKKNSPEEVIQFMEAVIGYLKDGKQPKH